MGIAMSITAFPVLARILEERGLTRTPLGTTAIACAAVDDVTAWSLLAVVVTLVHRRRRSAPARCMVLALIAFVAGMVCVVRPLLAPLIGHAAREPDRRAWRGAVVMLAAALATEVIGIHALFGAFLAGVVLPQSAGSRQPLRERLEALSVGPPAAALLRVHRPAHADRAARRRASWLSLRRDHRCRRSPASWAAACWPRAGPAWAGAMPSSLGALMNTRGLMELIVLNVGYDLGILSPRMFTMLVRDGARDDGHDGTAARPGLAAGYAW